MAKMLTLECPSCGGQFNWLRHPSTEPLPKHCPLCGAAEEELPQAVTAPHVFAGHAKNITRSADQTYRGMEAAGETNMKAAAAHLGVPESEMADLKITDLNDNLREGDAAAKMPANEVSRMVQQAPTILGHQGAEVGRFFADSTPKVGPDARAGMRATQKLRQFHAETYGSHLVSDRPSIRP